MSEKTQEERFEALIQAAKLLRTLASRHRNEGNVKGATNCLRMAIGAIQCAKRIS